MPRRRFPTLIFCLFIGLGRTLAAQTTCATLGLVGDWTLTLTRTAASSAFPRVEGDVHLLPEGNPHEGCRGVVHINWAHIWGMDSIPHGRPYGDMQYAPDTVDISLESGMVDSIWVQLVPGADWGYTLQGSMSHDSLVGDWVDMGWAGKVVGAFVLAHKTEPVRARPNRRMKLSKRG